MITSKIVYKGGLSTEATHVRSSTIITTDAPVDNRGKGESFSPTDLVATGLAACMLSIMGIKAEDKDLDIVGASVECTKTMASDPRRISKIEVKIMMPDNGYSEKDKIILEKAALSCPVAKSLHPDLEQVLTIVW
ncbi:MAG: putative redox protein [Maribacter sp.]|jgi:putative redox protein